KRCWSQVRRGGKELVMGHFRALVLHEEGGRVVPRLETVDEGRLPPGEVTVAVEYSTLNYKDGMILEGQGRLVRAYPHVPGVDFAGTVLRSDSPEFRPGDPVVLTGWRVGEVQWGGYAERARVKAGYLVRRPEGLTARQAMAIGTAGFTAMLAVIALETHGLTPDAGPGANEVLVTGAAACGLAGGSDLPATVIPFLLRGVNLLGIDSVMCPREERVEAWDRLARDLPLDKLEAVTQIVPLAEVPALAPRILKGEVRGRIV